MARHHYVSQFLLNGFCDESARAPFVWVADVETGQIKKKSPKNLHYGSDYYAWRGIDLEAPESILARFETRAAPVVRSMASVGYMLTPRDKYHLSQYLALQIVRLPHVLEHGEEMLKREAWGAIESRLHETEDAEEVRQRIRASGSVDHGAWNHAISLSIQSGIELLGGVLFSQRWVLMQCEEDVVFSSDQPIAMMAVDGLIPQIDFETGMNPELELLAPLDKRTMLYMHQHPGSGFERETVSASKALAYLKLGMLPVLRRLAFAPSEAIAKWVITEHRGSAEEWARRRSRKD